MSAVATKRVVGTLPTAAPCAEAPAPAAATAQTTQVTAEGFNVEQLKSILEVVAGRTRTLQQLIMLAQGECDSESYDLALHLDAAEIIATSIGAMTDAAVGAVIIGGHDEWNYGPLFTSAGKAVQA